jgi:hypothetical protein
MRFHILGNPGCLEYHKREDIHCSAPCIDCAIELGKVFLTKHCPICCSYNSDICNKWFWYNKKLVLRNYIYQSSPIYNKYTNQYYTIQTYTYTHNYN